MKVSFGLDFGTSNSALAVNRNGQVGLLDIDVHSPLKKSLKSVLYFIKEGGERKAFVGHEAVQEYIATGGEGRYLQSITTFLPDSYFEQTDIFYKNYTLEELIAFIPRTMKERGEKIVGTAVDDVVLGRPVAFSEDARKDKLAEERLKSAARLAGFKNIEFQLEPIAAALSFESALQNDAEKLLLVGDFGGGTSDFTILKASPKNSKKQERSSDILAVNGIYIGGDLFDSEIMWERICKYYGKSVTVKSMLSDYEYGLSTPIIAKLKRWHLIPHLRSSRTLQEIRELKAVAAFWDKALIQNLENLIQRNYGYLLFQSIEKAKCELSNSYATKITFGEYGMAIDEAIDQKEFDGFIEEKVNRIQATIDTLLRDANLRNSDIDLVFLTGGSSYVPKINKIFEDRFAGDKIRQSDAFTSVANGLGIYASKFH
ncbi:MAG: Hsp70 family protein [Desulfobacterales bacterium]|nr:Hsp70 family protein [Desulfobacterales bacterium]